MSFQPDYRNILNAANNKRPERLPLYEHIISPNIMEKIMDKKFADLFEGDDDDLLQWTKHFCRFYKEMTYDTVSYEAAIVLALPDGGKAIMGQEKGPIQSREDFNNYPWDEIPDMYWKRADRLFSALRKSIPEGMKAIGGVGNGVFEISEDLVGLEHLAYMQFDDPELFADVYRKIGDTMAIIWKNFLEKYGDIYCVCRFGDDLGYKSGTLTSPDVIRTHIMPQYKKIVKLVHNAGKPFLWHSCGCIFDVMDDAIEDVGIDAKHSNEDIIAPYDKWIDLYGERIGLFGGIDVDILCQNTPDEVFDIVMEKARRFRKNANGYALGSGNSIPDYVPAEGYLAMVKAAKRIRKEETA